MPHWTFVIISNRIVYDRICTIFNDSLQNFAVRVKVHNKLITIAYIYCPSNSIPRFHIKKFPDLIDSLPKQVCAPGDFNLTIPFGVATLLTHEGEIY